MGRIFYPQMPDNDLTKITDTFATSPAHLFALIQALDADGAILSIIRFTPQLVLPETPRIRLQIFSAQLPFRFWVEFLAVTRTRTRAAVGVDAWDNAHVDLSLLPPVWSAIRDHILDTLNTRPKPSQKDPEVRGKPVPDEKVREYHRLALTTRYSANQIQTKLKTTTRSYYDNCYRVLHEDYIDMVDRAQRIKQGTWPPATM